jgi:hypothetical protein
LWRPAQRKQSSRDFDAPSGRGAPHFTHIGSENISIACKQSSQTGTSLSEFARASNSALQLTQLGGNSKSDTPRRMNFAAPRTSKRAGNRPASIALSLSRCQPFRKIVFVDNVIGITQQ